jgi:hypothetical protein
MTITKECIACFGMWNQEDTWKWILTPRQALLQATRVKNKRERLWMILWWNKSKTREEKNA